MTIGTQRPPDTVKAWKPAVPGVSEVFHARFAEYAYPKHVHDTWTLFIVDAGEIRYDLDRHHRGAWHSSVSVLPPHVVHDGRPADDRGYVKRVLYLDTSVLGEDLIGRAVDRSAMEDPALRSAVGRLHPLLERPDDALEAESVTALVAERLRLHLSRRPAEAVPRDGLLARQLRELLEAHLLPAPDAGDVRRPPRGEPGAPRPLVHPDVRPAPARLRPRPQDRFGPGPAARGEDVADRCRCRRLLRPGAPHAPLQAPRRDDASRLRPRRRP